MKKNTILMILALGMMSGGFYGDAFATAPSKLQFTDNQQRKLMKDNVKKHINDIKKEKLLTNKKVRQSRWINLHTKSGVLTIPSKYTDIEYGTFRGVDSEYRTFRAMENVEHVVMSPNVRTIPTELFRFCCNLKSIDLQNVQSIGDFAFGECYKLTSVTIPKSVTSIGEDAFYCCGGLTSITIPDSVQSIGKNAFNGCDACIFTVLSDRVHELLTGSGVSKYRIKRPEEKPWWLPDDGKLVIPGDVKQIEYRAFINRNDITSVEIKDGVTSIGERAFFGCERLTSVTIPKSVKSIGKNAFSFCEGLGYVAIHDGIQSIGECAFCDCEGLTSITIPDSVEYIGDSVFIGCENLETIYVYSSRVKELVKRAAWSYSYGRDRQIVVII